MQRLVHRRGVGITAAAPAGPGSTIGPLARRVAAPLTGVGWASLAGAAAYLVIALWPYVVDGRRIGDQGDSLLTVALRVAGALEVALPAAIEWGYPEVARRNRRLLLGLAVLAAAEFLAPPVRYLESTLFEAVLSGATGDDPTPMLMLLSQVVGLAFGVLGVAGWTALLLGLGRAGARPRAIVLVLVVAAGVVLSGLAYVVPVARAGNLDVPFGDPAYIASFAMTLVYQAVLIAVALTLLAGAWQRLVPRRAWWLGAVAAIALFAGFGADLLQSALNPTTADGSTDLTLVIVGNLLEGGAVWLLLLFACLLGLGRGTDRRAAGRPRGTAFALRGGRRFRPAGT